MNGSAQSTQHQKHHAQRSYNTTQTYATKIVEVFIAVPRGTEVEVKSKELKKSDFSKAALGQLQKFVSRAASTLVVQQLNAHQTIPETITIHIEPYLDSKSQGDGSVVVSWGTAANPALCLKVPDLKASSMLGANRKVFYVDEYVKQLKSQLAEAETKALVLRKEISAYLEDSKEQRGQKGKDRARTCKRTKVP